MLFIGVLGDHLGEKTIHLISGYFEQHNKSWIAIQGNVNEERFFRILEEGRSSNTEFFLIALNEKTFYHCLEYGIRFHILLYLSGEKKAWLSQTSLKFVLDAHNIVIVNTDDKRIFPLMLSPASTLITCGMNTKANVTISSVTEEMGANRVICCIQRALPSLSGNMLEPQEFAVSVAGELQSVSGILAAVCTLMAGDMEIAAETDFSKIWTSKEKIFE